MNAALHRAPDPIWERIPWLGAHGLKNDEPSALKGDRKLIDVARSVGYDSDAAFSKAFKRVVGVSPRHFRRQNGEKETA